MPLLDSFKVDHTKMQAPSVRIAKVMTTPLGDKITVFDLRFCKPNIDIMGSAALHTLEHLFAGFMRDRLKSDNAEIIDISPMGCRTGFYMSVIGTPSTIEVASAWGKSMEDVVRVKSYDSIPEMNIYQCGTAEMHDLPGARDIADCVLKSGILITQGEPLPEHLLNTL